MGDSMWRLRVQYPGSHDLVERDVPVPESLDELKASLGVEGNQTLSTAHERHAEQLYTVERVNQLHSGAQLQVQIPRRRIYISAQPDCQKKAVVWYPGATLDQIERHIAKVAGFPAETNVELFDGEVSVALSVSIPNDTHLEVVPYPELAQRKGGGRGKVIGHASSSSFSLATETPASPQRHRNGYSSRKAATPMQSSPSNRSVGSSSVRRAASPGKAFSSPTRARAPTASGSGSTTPAVQQSAPEEHCLHILAGHTGIVHCICCVGDILFTGSQDNSIIIWDLNNLQFIGTLAGHKGFVKCVNASYGKKLLCSGSHDRTIRVWSLESFTTTKTLLGHTAGVNAVLILEGVDQLVSGSEDKTLRIWDLTSFDCLACLEQAHHGGIFALDRVGSSPVQVVSGARDRSLKIWDSSSWHATQTLHPPHYDGITSIAVASRHGKFYSGSRDRSIKEWDVGSLTNTLHTLHAHSDGVQALCMSTSEDVLFSGSRDTTVKVWDGELQCQDILQGHRGPVSALCTVGNRLFSASHDRTVRVWQIDQYG